MNIPINVSIALSAGSVSVLGAAVGFSLTSGRLVTPMPIWVGTCRAAWLKSGNYQDVIVGLVHAAATAHAVQLQRRIVELGGAGGPIDVATLTDELVPQVAAQIAAIAKVVAEITAADPAKVGTAVSPPG